MFEGETGPHLLNPLGGVHGGWALTLIDSAAGCAGHTLLPAGVGYTSVETKANFTRPITHDTGRVRAEGRVVGRGRQIMSAEARILDAAGRILAHGTSTFDGAAQRRTARSHFAGSMNDDCALTRESDASAFASSAFTRRPPQTMGCACWSTGYGRAVSRKKRRASICGSRTSPRARRCAAVFMAIRANGKNSWQRMMLSLRRDPASTAVASLREHLRSQPVTLLYAARDETHNNAVALKEWLERLN